MTSQPLSYHPTVYARPAVPPTVAVLTIIAVLVAMLVSAFVLDNSGIPYSTPGGNPLLKIHPMTYLALLAFCAAAISRGNPIQYLADCIARFPGAAFFLIMLIVMIAWTLLVQHQPLTSLVDTFLPATLFLFLISDLPPRQHRLLTIAIHLIMNSNAALGFVEVATGWRLTPISIAGETITWDWRASAFLGHPLENAMMTGIYLLMMLYGADRSVGPRLRAAIVILQMVGLVVFGGRVAMVLAFALVAIKMITGLFGLLRGMRFDPRLGAIVVMAVPVVIGAGLLAYNLGIFDRMIERFTNDGGSAETRASIITIFNSFPLYDLLMGPDPDVLVTKTHLAGSFAGIESFVFGFFLQSGMIISIIFFCGLGAMSFDLWRVGSRMAPLYIVYFYVVASGAASLSVKGQTLVQFVVLFTTIEAMPSIFDREP